MRIILASKSPRRSELLKKLDIDFEVLVTNAEEELSEALPPEEYVSIIARRKAERAAEIFLSENSGSAVIIAADTTVYIDGKFLCKPKDKNEAIAMIKLLENKAHYVYTGLCVAFITKNNIEYVEDYCSTKVIFKALTDAQIENYVSTNEPYDKAGAYAIQGSGGEFIAGIEGDYTNVVGLPLNNLRAILERKG